MTKTAALFNAAIAAYVKAIVPLIIDLADIFCFSNVLPIATTF